MADERKFWADRYAELLQQRVKDEPVLQKVVAEKGWISYDEKTPSGRIHIGSGRGWVIHDTVARALRDAGLNGRFILSSDDMDPMDDLPPDNPEKYKPYMGVPFRFIPSPVSGYESYGDYYFREATERFEDYGIEAELERTGDHYFNGDFNRTIKLALDNAEKIQQIYSRFHKGIRATEVLPFKPICEKCQKIGTTLAYTWNSEEGLLDYRCEPALVDWARGCGYEGTISPYNGTGKFPWKVEWAAKWPTIGVIFETAGKDHFSAGGSRDIAIPIAKEVFNYPPPFPSSYKAIENGKGYSYKAGESYEFFTIGGAKMSSSKGKGFPFSEMSNIAPGYITKFLLVRTRPKSSIDFDPSKDMERVYRDYDDTERRYYEAKKDEEVLKRDEYFNAYRLFQLCSVDTPLESLPPQIDFSFGVMLVQITQNTDDALKRLHDKGYLNKNKLSKLVGIRVMNRLEFLRKWVNQFASEEQIIRLSQGDRVEMSQEDRAMVNDFLEFLEAAETDADNLIEGIKRVYTENRYDVKDFHSKIYQLLFDRPSGPRLVPYIQYAGAEDIIKTIKRRSEIGNRDP